MSAPGTEENNMEEEVTKEKSSHQQKRSSGDVYATLPKLEIIVYGAFLLFSYTTVIYKFCKLSKSREEDLLTYGYIEEGWRVLNRGQDSDFEWNYWKSHLTPTFLGLMIVYILFSRAVEVLIPKQRETVYMFACIGFLMAVYNRRIVAVLILQTFMSYLVSKTRRKSIVWIIAIAQMAAFNYSGSQDFIQMVIDDETADDFTFLSALCLLKFISFSLECCDQKNIPSCPKTGQKQDTLYDLFVYIFYLPLFLIGPILVYSKFRVQMNQPVHPTDKQKYLQCFWEALHYFGWVIFIEVALHYAYHTSLSFDSITLNHASYLEIAGYAMCSLLYFQVKYMALYGLPRLLCLLDGVDSPKPPMCIHAMYTFKDTWKFFDRGLHEFMVRYIYIPLGGSKAGLLWQQLASISCFGMVYFWHGGTNHVLCWAVLNWAGLTFETICEVVIRSKMNRPIIATWLSGAMKRRLVAMVRGVMYLSLALSNMFFLSGIRVTKLVIWKVCFTGNPLHTLLSWFFYYCIVQVLMEVYHTWGRAHICNKSYYYMGGQKEKRV